MLMRLPYDDKDQLVMVLGVSTEGLTDDDGKVLNGIFEVSDTVTYPTAIGGSKTVLVLEPFNTKAVEAFLNKK